MSTTYTPQHVYDALPSSPDTRDYAPEPVDAAALPDHIALPNVPPLDQARQGACVGHGCAGARETLELIPKVQDQGAEGSSVGYAAMGALRSMAMSLVPLSRAFIYYEARKLEGTTRQDAGAEVRDGCKVMQQLGVCTEADFPYSDKIFAKAPPRADLAKAAPYKIATYTRLTTPDQVRAALAAGQPVVIGIAVYQSFEQKIGPDGMVPMPATAREQLLGGHCVFLWGYHPDPKKPGASIFDAQNSWGPDWADHGRMHFPQAYIADGNLTSDLWAISL